MARQKPSQPSCAPMNSPQAPQTCRRAFRPITDYGVTQWFPGNSVEARTHLEHAVAVFNPERYRDLAFRFGQDVGVSAMVYLAIVLWPLGEVDRAREIADATVARIAK